MEKIEFQANNNRTMQISQQKYDGVCTLSTFNNTTNEVDHEENISAGDMVMLMNYYQYIKSNNIQCDFINPNPKSIETKGNRFNLSDESWRASKRLYHAGWDMYVVIYEIIDNEICIVMNESNSKVEIDRTSLWESKTLYLNSQI